MLRQAKSSPDINNYLTYLSVTSTPTTNLTADAYHAARSAAAIMLKNNVKSSYKSVDDSSKEYIKSHVLYGLQDRTAQIRNFVGNVITEVVKQGGILLWPQVLPDLVAMVASEGASPEVQDGAMGAICKICEDNRRALDQEYHSQRPLAFLLPQLLNFTKSPNAKVRSRALSAINVFLREPVALTMREHINEILPEIVRLTQDSNDDVRRFVCRAFAMLADAMPPTILPYIEGIVMYTISQQKDVQNQELALDAAEFFFEASGNAKLRDALGPYLESIVPVLLDCMVYSEDDQLRLEAEAEDDAELEDDIQDIKPQFATAKTSRTGETAPATQHGTQTKASQNGYAYADDDDDDTELSDGEVESDDDGEGDPEEEWNLRKCSAAALDSLATHFHGKVFEITLPWLIENLKHKDWPNREAAVLAVGAIGPGCMEYIVPHLPELIPYMLSLLSDSQPVVRQITCWALGRYLQWAVDLIDEKRDYFEAIMDGLLKCMLDSNKKVQESAASAFASLQEAARAKIAPYCTIILQQFVQCFQRYKDKNIYILYDCIQTLAEGASPILAEQRNVDLLMPALIERWHKVPDQSREMFPLLECLSFVATALGRNFTPFAGPLFMRCIKLIQQNLEDSAAANIEGSYIDPPDKDFLVTSLDLLSSILQALEETESTKLAKQTQPDMFELLGHCMVDRNDDVRQSAYALLGDSAIYMFAFLQPRLEPLLGLLIHQLSVERADQSEDRETACRVINNACWSCGEIAMRQKEGMMPYIDQLKTKLATIMFSTTVPESLNENAAIALGRLGIGCHQQLAPHLGEFAGRFLQLMQRITWTDEKGHAYRGFTGVVLDNPAALESCLLDFFNEMASAPGIFLTSMGTDGPLRGFELVLTRYREMVPNFDQYLKHLKPEKELCLRQLYTF